MPRHRKRQPIKFEEWFVVLNGCVPLVMMLLDAKHHRLGVDPIRASLHITGSLAIGTLLLTLVVTPVRVLTGMEESDSVSASVGVDVIRVCDGARFHLCGA